MRIQALSCVVLLSLLGAGCQCGSNGVQLDDGGSPGDGDSGVNDDGGVGDGGLDSDGGPVDPDGGETPGCTRLTCAQLGFSCGPAGDGCGGLLQCGTCSAPQTCGGGGTSSVCGGTQACVPLDCTSADAGCGPVANGCGGLLQCGSCQAPKSCGGGGSPNHCGGNSVIAPDGGTACIPRDCASQGVGCGPAGNGCGGTLNCGGCTAPQTCGGGGQPSQCGGTASCVPKNCTQLGFNCGPAGDGCGGLLSCGTCNNGNICGGAGSPGVCGGADAGSATCTNLCLRQTVCDGGGSTTLTGTVVTGTDPDAGFGQPDPVYNALVYIPNGAVAAFPSGVACDKCGATASGSPLVSTTTGPDGKFTLYNVPTGANVPLVMQLGRWRRQVTISNVPSCQSTPLPTTVTRLPRNQSEGNIPKMAIATGNVDLIECVLRKMGVENSEFTPPTGTGRVHLYQDNGAAAPSGTTAQSQLYGSASTLANYDMVLFPCRGSEVLKAVADQQRVIDYADIGGRVFATHYSYVWLFNISPWMGTAQWNVGQNNPPDPVTGYLNTSATFPKGQDFSQWVSNVGAASPDAGMVQIHVGRHDVDGVNAPTQDWIHTQAPNAVSTQHLTFNTPVGATAPNQCGRVLFSDFHVTNGTGSGQTFPAECTNTPLSPQEKILEFMILDLSSCIIPDEPPIPSCSPKTCSQLGFNCGPQGDGCGGLLACGTCTAPKSCGGGGVSGVCGAPPCAAKSCTDLGYNCGPAGDGCGNALNCGTCASPKYCGANSPGVCGTGGTCSPRTCQAQGLSCGPAGDGCGTLLNCGSCTAPQTCGGGGTLGVCGAPSCTPKSCVDLGFNCGPAGDGCGGQLDCGTCAAPQTCGGSGEAGKCSKIIF